MVSVAPVGADSLDRCKSPVQLVVTGKDSAKITKAVMLSTIADVTAAADGKSTLLTFSRLPAYTRATMPAATKVAVGLTFGNDTYSADVGIRCAPDVSD